MQIVTLLIVGSLLAAPVPKGAKKLDYCPLAVGHKWERVEGDDVKTSEVVSVEEVDNVRTFTIVITGVLSPPDVHKRVYRVEKDDIFSVGANDLEADRPGLVMKRVIKPGDEWKTEHSWRGGALWKMTHKVGEPQKIKTPAGEFTALPVEQVYELGTERRWYADGIGTIRYEKDGKVISELKSFTPAK
jgi:hypothetical protein